MKKEVDKEKRILLLLLPYWTPLIPALGISSLKSYLEKHGFEVKTVDANLEIVFREIYYEYFKILEECIPVNKRSNFSNIGNRILEKHLMAHFNHKDEGEYIELVKLLLSKYYAIDIDNDRIIKLNKLLKTFYSTLDNFVMDMITEVQPKILGLSVFRGTLAASLYAARITKERISDIITIMGGGIFADLTPGSVDFNRFIEKVPYVDKVIVGEGELLFKKYLDGDLPESKKVFTIEDIGNEVLDFSDLDTPDFSDFDISTFLNLAGYASRSCPFQCGFCSETVYWGKYRRKNEYHVCDELMNLSEKYKRQLFLLADSLLNPVIEGITKEFTKRKSSIYFDGYLRADEICNKENALKWRKSGFYRARLGLESGSPRVLEMMNKKITPDLIRRSLFSLANAGIKTTTYWVVGYPGETEDDFQRTLELISEVKDNIYEAEANPFELHPSGQVNSLEWAGGKKITGLFPNEYLDMLLTQTYCLVSDPSWEEIFDRLLRFTQHCKKLGIPNPYTMQDIYKADMRWAKLHNNAVPSALRLNSGKYIKENVEKDFS